MAGGGGGGGGAGRKGGVGGINCSVFSVSIASIILPSEES